MAEPLDGKSARKLLFSPKGVDVQMAEGSGLDATQNATMEAILKAMKGAGLANYYGAAAVSPDFFAQMAEDPGQATLSGLLQVTEKLHSPAAAERVALSACETARSSGDAPCVLAARIMPKRWKARELSMSVGATAAFKGYRKGKGEKAFAISQETVAFAVATGDGAAELALERCNANASKTGSADCEVVIQD